MLRSLLPVGAALLGASSVLAADIPTCSLSKLCPESAPCCSQYGQCGVGAYCLGGCDPRMSFSLKSCVPSPVCESKTYKMDSLDPIVSIDKYLGDPKTADWVYQGEPALYGGNVLLTMPPRSVGTVLATTTYMWYGNVKAKLKTSIGAGVVTAFILFSDVKDEIDYEFVGTELTTAQTNYYFQGIPNYDNSANITLSNTYDNWHEYEIQWTPDEITWLVDGQVGRTKKRSETWNATANQWNFPQTPSRVQISIWPGGADTNAKGTIDWAGGPIDWDSDYIKQHKYYFATFGEISVECYKTSSPPGTNSGVSYTYTARSATNNTVVDGDSPTVLKSFLGTGSDMNAGDTSTSGTAALPSATTVNSIPGGGSPAQVPGGSGSGTGTGNGGGTGSGSGSGSGGSATTGAACQATGFTQDCSTGTTGTTGTSNKNEAGGRGVERVSGGSAFAVVVGFVVMMLI
ncbi:concanavalin A-like lectin/glucanase domain-containing protein [Podospora appendiculata]|uniref:Crh-like protein n=1 Tax=Podospora appendiculata TaxID=314037 RepID=A0AAE1C776_9PEZI|nr:concanavalin A-like lectin/glucanase domain-containing protein [Podospora appendiculata]